MQKVVLTVVATISALVCVSAMNTTATNYVEMAKATQQMKGELINLEVAGEDTIVLTLRFSNISSLDLFVQRMSINIYANGEYLGNFDMKERTPLVEGDTLTVIRAVINPYYLPKLKAESDKGEIHWYISGAAVIEFPFEKWDVPLTVNLRIEEAWGG